MPNPGIAQPDALPLHKFRLDGVLCVEDTPGAIGPSLIIVAGNTFRLRTDLGFDGSMDTAYIGDLYGVVHHWQRLEDGLTGFLPPPPDANVPGGPALAHFTSNTGPYTTGVAASSAHLRIAPAPFATGTFRITTHVHFRAPNQATVAAYHDGLILMVILP